VPIISTRDVRRHRHVRRRDHDHERRRRCRRRDHVRRAVRHDLVRWHARVATLKTPNGMIAGTPSKRV